MRTVAAFSLLASTVLEYSWCMRITMNTSTQDEHDVENDLTKGGDCKTPSVKCACKNPRVLWREAANGLKAGGNYGKVVEVTKTRGNCASVSSRTEFFMLKYAKSSKQHVIESFTAEKSAMLAAETCSGVMKVIEEEPCTERAGVGKAKSCKDCCNTEKHTSFAEWQRARSDGGAFVMRKMTGGTLKEWNHVDYRGQITRKDKNFHYSCGAKLVAKVAEALTCLHGVGWIHSDVKLDNIFLSEVSNNCKGAACCPDEVFLADLGLAKEIDQPYGQYPSGYGCSNHLPGGMFGDSPQDELGLTTGQTEETYLAKADIDWCSFAYMVQDRIRLSVDDFQIPATCGTMGHRGTCE